MVDRSSDVDAGMRSIQYSVAAMAAAGFSAYFAAKEYSKPFVEEATRSNRAMLIGGIGIGAVMVSTVYAFFIVYRGSMRTKMFAMIALLLSLGGGWGGFTIGWKKGGNPATFQVM